MTADEIRQFALSLPGATESIKWGHDLCFSVGEKMFLVINAEGSPVTGSFKATRELFDELTEKEGFTPAPYLAKHMWVYFDNASRLPARKWKSYVESSYDLIFEKLPAKMKKKIRDN